MTLIACRRRLRWNPLDHDVFRESGRPTGGRPTLETLRRIDRQRGW